MKEQPFCRERSRSLADVGDLTRGAPSEDVLSAARWRRGSRDGAAGGGVRSSLVISMLRSPEFLHLELTSVIYSLRS